MNLMYSGTNNLVSSFEKCSSVYGGRGISLEYGPSQVPEVIKSQSIKSVVG